MPDIERENDDDETLPVAAVMAALAVCEVPVPTAMEVLRVARHGRDSGKNGPSGHHWKEN